MGWKMVRDMNQKRINEHVSGQWRTAPDPVSSLIKKIGEEYGELVEDRNPEELYDIRDVLEELIVLMDPEKKAFTRHQEKVAIMGFFEDHLEWHPNPDVKLRGEM